MKSIHVLRKPCSRSAPTVAANVLRHGTGGLNIDMTRVAGMAPSVTGQGFRTGKYGGQIGHGETTMSGIPSNPAPEGRWPANLVLQHLDGCAQDGVKKVKTGTAHQDNKTAINRVYGAFNPKSVSGMAGYSDPDGTETVAAWACASGCPVAALDAQSGTSQSASGVVKYVRAETSGWKERGGSFTPGHTWEAQAYGDKGGASRYFKQMQNGTAESTTPTPDPPTLPVQVQTEAQ